MFVSLAEELSEVSEKEYSGTKNYSLETDFKDERRNVSLEC
jgi:hypothetical protein